MHPIRFFMCPMAVGSGLTDFQDQRGPAVSGCAAGPQKVAAALHDGLLDAFDNQAGGGGSLGVPVNHR